MNWMTVAWPMVTAACITLALINLRIALGDSRRAPHVFFSLAALAVAAVSALELALMRTDNLARYDALMRWAAVPVWVMVASVTGFVWTFFRTGRVWLAIAGVGINGLANGVNMITPIPAIRHAVDLRQVEGFGGVSFTVPTIVNGPWDVVEMASVALVILFVVDASVSFWKAGGRRTAWMVGGSTVFFLILSRTHAVLIERGFLQAPYFISFAFLGVLIAMGIELGDEVLRAAALTRDLHESERRMELAAQAANLGFWNWNLATGELWANETARELFEIPSNERVDLTRFMNVLHPDDRDSVTSAIQTALSGDLEYDKEYRVVLPGGGERWIAARGRVETGPDGKPALMRGVLLDITAGRKSEDELRQVRGQLAHSGRVSMMGQLATALAHEINQPLGAILRNAEAAELFMQDANPNLDEVRAIIADIRKDDQRAGEVIDRLRALLKRRDIESRPLSTGHLLDEVLALIRGDASARGVRLEVLSEPGLPPVKGDRVHLQQVLINLIINAMDALGESKPADRRVVVNARPDGPGFVEISVTDNGCGIPPERLAHVFDPFFTTKAHGMGMGLPISRTIIEAHGGKITASNAPGGGAVFRFTLPAAGSPEGVEDGKTLAKPDPAP